MKVIFVGGVRMIIFAIYYYYLKRFRRIWDFFLVTSKSKWITPRQKTNLITLGTVKHLAWHLKKVTTNEKQTWGWNIERRRDYHWIGAHREEWIIQGGGKFPW